MDRKRKKSPELTIEVNARGVHRIIVDTYGGRRAEGLMLLSKLLPAVNTVNQLVRQGETEAP
jgi:hypothetical protein